MINKKFLVFSFVWWKVYAYKHKMIWKIISFKFSTSKNVTLKMLFSGPFYFYISDIFFVIILGWEKKNGFYLSKYYFWYNSNSSKCEWYHKDDKISSKMRLYFYPEMPSEQIHALLQMWGLCHKCVHFFNSII